MDMYQNVVFNRICRHTMFESNWFINDLVQAKIYIFMQVVNHQLFPLIE